MFYLPAAFKLKLMLKLAQTPGKVLIMIGLHAYAHIMILGHQRAKARDAAGNNVKNRAGHVARNLLLKHADAQALLPGYLAAVRGQVAVYDFNQA